jgi:hypothetical protein
VPVSDKDHAERLLGILSKDIRACNCCPYADHEQYFFSYTTFKYEECKMCNDFLGIVSDGGFMFVCPCNELGGDEAVKRTWIALEEGGYL